MGKKLVLTGATNNPGRVLVEQMGRNRTAVPFEEIVSVHRESSDTKHFESFLPDGKKAICDLTDTEGLTRVFRGADAVLHVAGIHWSKEVATAAAACGVRRLIVVHTCGVYSRYKAAGEGYRQIDEFVERTCKAKGIVLTVLRPTMIYGNARDRNVIKFVGMVDKLPLMPVVNGARYELQPVHYADVGMALYNVLLNEEATEGKEFVLSGFEPILLRDMLTIIGNHLGKRVRFISCPFWVAYPGAVMVWVATLGRIDYREKVQRLCEPRAYGHDAAAEAFGFSPRSFEDGVAVEVQEYRGMR